MTVRGGFFNSINGDRTYNAEDMNLPYKDLISNGVIPSTSNALQVMASSGLNTQILAGSGLFGDGWAYNDAPIIKTHDAAHTTLDRIDIIVMRRDSTESIRAANVFVKKGTPGSSPVAPTVERSTYIKEYCLAEVYIAAGATEITQANITDTRADTTRCGWCTGLINQVDTSTLFAQWQAAYEEQFDENQEAFESWWADARHILENDTTAAAQILNLTNNKADRDTATLTLNASEWALSDDNYYYQTVTVSGVTANDVILVNSSVASVECITQAANSLTFKSSTAVNADIKIINFGGVN